MSHQTGVVDQYLLKILEYFIFMGNILCITIGGRAVLVAASNNFLDTKYEFYGFNDDLRDTIN